MNVPQTGRVYQVVDKTTGEIVKIGSTIHPLRVRFRQSDYKHKYTNHILLEIRAIESSEFDWYEPKNALCPFLWHLVAIEHLEIFKAGTFQKGVLSNKISPLIQKFRGLSGQSSIGGIIGGKKAAEINARNKTGIFSHENRVKGGQISGRRAVESGLLDRIRTVEGSVKGGTKTGKMHADSGHMSFVGKKHGPVQGRRNIESGLLARIRPLSDQAHREGSRLFLHKRWHVKRNLFSANCKFCGVI